MRIALVTAHYPPATVPCGVGDYTHCLRAALEALGHRCLVITSLRSCSREPYVYPLADTWGGADCLAVWRVLRKERPDAIVIQYTPEHYGYGVAWKFLPFLVRWTLRRSVLVTTFHTLVGGPWRAKLYAALLAAGSHGVISIHHELSELYRRRLPWWADKMREIPIGANIPGPGITKEAARERLRHRLGLDMGVAVMGTFGFPSPGKGLETLLHALRVLNGDPRAVHLVHIGETREEDRPHRAELEGLAQRLGVDKRVHWLGGLPDQETADLLSGIDAFVVPYDEGASLRRGTLLAGFRLGMPVITTTPRYSDPSLQHDKTIISVPPRSPQALADGIRACLADPDLRERITHASARMSARFAWPAIAAEHVEFMRTIQSQEGCGLIGATKRILHGLHGLLTYGVWRMGRICLPRSPVDAGGASGRVCVLQVNALGDVLMVTPLLRALIEALGPGRVDVVVKEHTAPLLVNFPGLGARITLKRHLSWRDPVSVLAFFRLARELRARRYQAVLDSSRLMQSAWLTYLARPARGIGLQSTRTLGPFTIERLEYLYTHEVEVDSGAHMIRQNLSLLEPLGIPSVSDRIEFTPTATDRLSMTAWLSARGVLSDQPYAAIHPGAKWPPKRWHAERFQLLIRRFQSAGIAVVLAGDVSDRSLLEAVAGGIVPSPAILAGDLQLGAVGALIQGARVFIGNDSGLMHLASAVGTPIVALFGPTVPGRTGPLTSPGCAIMKPIECRPCRLYYTRDRCERGHNYCMDLITVEEVWSVTESVLKENQHALSSGRRIG